MTPSFTRPGALALFPLLASLLAAACDPDLAPEAPTWVDDVQPILRSNCVRCHGERNILSAPDYFRLDLYDDLRPEGSCGNPPERGCPKLGAASPGVAVEASARVDLPSDVIGAMPPLPTRPLTDRQKTILRRWAAAIPAPLRGVRAAERPPTITLRRPIDGTRVTAGSSLTIDYVTDDPDGDVVTGEIRFGAARGENVIAPIVNSGAGQVTWNTAMPAVIPPGTYILRAGLADDAQRGAQTETVVVLGTVTVGP